MSTPSIMPADLKAALTDAGLIDLVQSTELLSGSEGGRFLVTFVESTIIRGEQLVRMDRHLESAKDEWCWSTWASVAPLANRIQLHFIRVYTNRMPTLVDRRSQSRSSSTLGNTLDVRG